MDRQQATAAIKARWRELYPADGGGRGKGIICPICGSGSGPNGSGITAKPNSPNHFLKCWHGGCDFERGGSVIDLYMLQHGMNPDSGHDFAQAVDALAAQLGISIDPWRRSAADDFGGRALDWNDVIGDGERHPAARSGPQAAAPAPFSSGTGTPTAAPATDTAPAAAPAAMAPQPSQKDYTAYYERCMANLAESAEAQAYLTNRGISLDTAAAAITEADGCFMGFDPAWRSPTAIARLQAQGKNWAPAPTPRIIIPVTKGYYIARDIRPDLDEGQRKFAKMNEGEPAILFSSALYGGAENVFIVEGAFDAYSIMEAGQTAIALNSTSNADKLLKQLEQRPTAATLILCLDSDEPGKKAARKLKEGLTRLNVSFVEADITGSAKDPNEALTADRAAFVRRLDAAIADTATRPDNTAAYLDGLMAGEIQQFRQARNRQTGFPNLDEKAGGLYSGLYVLAAISSLGKTTLALQMADQIAAAGHEVLFFSMEQSRLEMVSKSLARLTAQADLKTAVTSLSIRNGLLPAQVLAAVDTYKAQTGDRLSIIEGNFNADIGFIADYVRRYKQRTGTGPVVFVDYLQILQPAADGKTRGSKKDEIDLAVTELKRLSRELELPIIVISSLNRANYLTPFAFESLKESGSIEYTADVVWGLQLACLDEELFDTAQNIISKRKRVDEAKAATPRKVKFVCLKNRYGISSYECYFDYYPANDLFLPVKAPTISAQTPAKGARRI